MGDKRRGLGPGFRGCRDLIQRPSWGKVLSAIGPEAAGEVRVLEMTLVGLDAPVCVPAAAQVSDGPICAAAELLTTSLCELLLARFTRLSITRETVLDAPPRGHGQSQLDRTPCQVSRIRRLNGLQLRNYSASQKQFPNR